MLSAQGNWCPLCAFQFKTISTEAQIQANRENAKLSSGPQSEAGKAISALNNTRHGLTGAFRVLPTESQSDFDELLAAFREEHQPATTQTGGTRPQARAARDEKERHKWDILLAEVKVDGQQLRDLNRDIAESERMLARTR
jgi:hypothetical protein